MSELSSTDFFNSLPEDLRVWLAERRIDEVECVIPDMVGAARGKAMPTKKFRSTSQMYLSPHTPRAMC